jgi:predicted nucleic acid-binding Zn ribbon protein
MSTRGPRPLAQALNALAASLAPRTTLSSVQACWERVAGPSIAAAAHPASEREGVLTVRCESSVWAHELELMAPALLERLNCELGADMLTGLRCRTA